MKLLRICSGYEFESINDTTFTMESTGTNKRYMIHDYLPKDTPLYSISFQMSVIAPYDDADYIWANCSGKSIRYSTISGKIVDTVKLRPYKDDDWEDFDEYCNAILEETMKTLDRMNKNIKPRILHD